MLSQANELHSQDISRMSRQELIAGLLEINKVSTFKFSAAWLARQWTRRLRSLLLAARRQAQVEG